MSDRSAKKDRQRDEDAEDARIAAGIAADPDAWELTDEDFARMRPAHEVLPDLVEAYRRSRGRQKAATKQQVTLRLDRDILAHFRKDGPGWQTRLNAALRRHVFGGRKVPAK